MGFFLILSFSIIPAVQGPCEESYEIYIRNQPYAGEIVKKAQDFYVSLEQFAKTARMPLRQKEKVSFLFCREDQEAPAGMSEGLLVNGKPFTGPLINRDGRVFVPLKEIAAAVGAAYYINKNTRIIDVVFVNTTISREASSGNSSAPAPSVKTLLYYYFDG